MYFKLQQEIKEGYTEHSLSRREKRKIKGIQFYPVLAVPVLDHFSIEHM